ncbi:MAG: sulfatase [Planctomycetes bacterium]|nr:sulfatase [Planctomycetota bacterium]
MNSPSTRTRRSFVALALALGTTGLTRCSKEPPLSRQPTGHDVVLIVIDTLRADRLGCYGYDRPTSPTIDELATSGARVSDCWSQSSWTGPSMVSLMTGRHVARDFVKMAAIPTLAERLKRAGYATIGMQWNGLLKEGHGFERGFDRYLFKPRALEIGQALMAMPPGPRFVYIHLTDPHDPYDPGPPFDDYAPRPPRSERLAEIERFLATLHPDWPTEQVRTTALNHEHAMARMSALYDGEVERADQTVRNLLGVLERLGRRENSIVIIAADHGESLFDHREAPSALTGDEKFDPMKVWKMGHAALLTESLLRVPLIFQGPGIPRGVVLDGPQENIDVVPTVLELLGLPTDELADGESLAPKFAALARAESAPGKDLVFANTAILTAVRSRSGWKLTLPWPTAPLERAALFDLRNDPREASPLPAQGEIAEKLTRAIERFRESALVPGRSEDVVDDEVRERMRELGYVGGK